MESKLNSSKPAFGWYQAMGRYGKVKMSKNWVLDDVGKGYSVITRIISRLREISLGQMISMPFLEWVAEKASNEVFVQAIEVFIKAWHAQEKVDSLEWFIPPLYISKPWKEAREWLSNDNWRMPDIQEMNDLRESGKITAGVYWTCKLAADSEGHAVTYDMKTGKCSTSAVSTYHYVIAVRAKRKTDTRWLCPKCRKTVDELRVLGKTRFVQGYEQCADCHADICSPGEAGPGGWTGLIKNG